MDNNELSMDSELEKKALSKAEAVKSMLIQITCAVVLYGIAIGLSILFHP